MEIRLNNYSGCARREITARLDRDEITYLTESRFIRRRISFTCEKQLSAALAIIEEMKNDFVEYDDRFFTESECVYCEPHSELVPEAYSYTCHHCNERWDSNDLNDDAGDSTCGCYWFCCSDCAESQDYESDGWGEYQPIDETGGGITGYHDRPRDIRHASERYPWRIGLEIEKEDRQAHNDIANREIVLPDGWIAETDSSLGSYGFELVSPAYNLDKDSAEMDRAINTLSPAINAGCSTSCGGHINLSHYDKTGESLAKAMGPGLALICCLFPKRLRNTYCRAKSLDNCCLDCDKYQPVRICHNRIEIRVFNRVRSVEILNRRIELVSWLAKHQPDNETICESLADGRLFEMLNPVYKNRPERWSEIKKTFPLYSDWFLLGTIDDQISHYVNR